MEILGAVAIVAITGALIVWPLLRQHDARPPEAVRSRQNRARTAALAAIRELEFDFQTGKISSEDYAVLRARYEAKAVEAMAAVPSAPARDLEAEIEARIAAARTQRYCAACGEALPSTARFCPACGAVVTGVRR